MCAARKYSIDFFSATKKANNGNNEKIGKKTEPNSSMMKKKKIYIYIHVYIRPGYFRLFFAVKRREKRDTASRIPRSDVSHCPLSFRSRKFFFFRTKQLFRTKSIFAESQNPRPSKIPRYNFIELTVERTLFEFRTTTRSSPPRLC